MQLAPAFVLALAGSARAHRRRAPDPPSSAPALSVPTIVPSTVPTSFVSLPSSFSTVVPSSPSPSTTSTPSSASSPPSSVAFSSATPASTASPSLVTSTSSAPSPPVAVTQPQPSSSSTPITLLNGAGTPTQDSSSFVVVSTAATSSTATPSSSPSFFANTGAVAGTFTVVGLVSIAGVIALALLILRHRHSRSFEDDTEYLDKSPDLSADPPVRQVTSPDDSSASDHPHYGAPPMALATPAAVYYPDHAYALHPQAFLPEAYPPPRSHGYPTGFTQDYAALHTYSPEDYDIAYPPPAPRVDHDMSNPRHLTNVELHSAPVPQTPAALSDALRPSIKSTPSAPKQWASTRFSVDSFYAGIAKDTSPSPGRAL